MIDSSMVGGAVHAVKASTRQSTSGFRPLPDFLIIGGQRCATTSLYYYLRAHLQVLPALTKEVRFLALHWSRGEGWYRAQFPRRARKTSRRVIAPLTFEATPYCLAHPLAAARAAQLLPDVKRLVLLRDPVTRPWSHYRHMVRLGLEPLSAEAIAKEPARPAGGYARVLEFLVLPAWTPASFPIHTRNTKGSPAMSTEIRRRLEEHFAPSIRQLEQLLGRAGLDDPWAFPATRT